MGRNKRSKGCEACRRRKIGCDQRKEGCKNCERSGRRCPGYRDELDLLFVHETDQVVKKHGENSEIGVYDEQISNGIALPASKGRSERGIKQLDDAKAVLVQRSGRPITDFGYAPVDDWKSRKFQPHSKPPTSEPDFSRIRSPVLVRTQIKAVATEFLGPDASSRASSPVWSLLSVRENDWTAFTLAFDALALTQLGLASSDERLVSQGQRTYSLAICALQKELARLVKKPAKTAISYSDAFLATPYLLFLCEQFSPIASLAFQGNVAVTPHFQGFAQLVRARQSPDGLSNIQLMLLDDFHQYALGWCIATRRPPQFSCAMSEAEIEEIDKMTWRFPRMTQVMMGLPDMLLRADKLSFCISVTSADQVVNDVSLFRERRALLLEIQRCHIKLDKVVQNWSDNTALPCYYEYLNRSWLIPLSSELTEISTAAFGDTGIWFPSAGAAFAWARLWMSLLILYDLEYQVRTATAVFDPTLADPGASVRHNATITADNLCMCIEWLCAQPDIGSHGCLGATPVLQYARPWYVGVGEIEKVAWCDAVRRFVLSKGLFAIPPR